MFVHYVAEEAPHFIEFFWFLELDRRRISVFFGVGVMCLFFEIGD